jgi:hypothetical protein
LLLILSRSVLEVGLYFQFSELGSVNRRVLLTVPEVELAVRATAPSSRVAGFASFGRSRSQLWATSLAPHLFAMRGSAIQAEARVVEFRFR